MLITRIMKFADYVTLSNSACGLISIWSSINHNFYLASIFMILAVVFDSLDGRIARVMKSQNNFGAELDSLSDVVSFAIAPFVFGLEVLGGEIIAFSGMFFVLCGILRLARFNITHLKYFEGVPITTNGILFPMLWIAFGARLEVFSISYIIMGILMISSVKIKKI